MLKTRQPPSSDPREGGRRNLSSTKHGGVIGMLNIFQGWVVRLPFYKQSFVFLQTPNKTCWVVFSKKEEDYLRVLGRHITDENHAQRYLEAMVSRIDELQIANIKVVRINKYNPVPNKLTPKGKDAKVLAIRIGKLDLDPL